MLCNCMKRDGKNCIELVPIFSNLNYDEMMEIARITRDRTYEKQHDLWRETTTRVFMSYMKGRSRSQDICSGKAGSKVLGPGEFIGELTFWP